MALGYAAIALVILAVFLPVAMVYKSRQVSQEGYRAAGGNTSLVVCFLAGVVIIVAQLAAG